MELQSGLYVVLQNTGIDVFDGVQWIGEIENIPKDKTLLEFLMAEAEERGLILQKEEYFPWCFYIDTPRVQEVSSKGFWQSLFTETNHLSLRGWTLLGGVVVGLIVLEMIFVLG